MYEGIGGIVPMIEYVVGLVAVGIEAAEARLDVSFEEGSPELRCSNNPSPLALVCVPLDVCVADACAVPLDCSALCSVCGLCAGFFASSEFKISGKSRPLKVGEARHWQIRKPSIKTRIFIAAR